MRKLIVAVIVLLIIGAATYVAFRLIRKPIPTPLGWKAHATTIAGDGSPVALSDPFGVAVAKDGTLYIADAGESNRIHKISPEGTLTTLAGGKEGFSDGAGAAASFNSPSAIALDPSGNLIVADTGNNRIRKVTPEGQVTTIAEGFNGPIGVAMDARGNIYVADSYNDRIQMITADGQVMTVAGKGTPGYADGDRNTALFDTPCGIVAASDGSLIIADTGNDRLRKITPEGNVTTLPITFPHDDYLSNPVGLALSHDNFLYVTELDRSRILQVAPDGTARTITVDDNIRFNQASVIALGPHSNRPAELYVADSGNYLVRKLDQTVVTSAATIIDSLPRLSKETLGQQSLIWPVDPQDKPHEVVATMGEVRGSFDSDDSRHHLHSGLDVFGPYGEVVRVVRSEKITSPLPNWAFGSINEGVRVGLVSYIHIHVGRDKDAKMFDDPRFMQVFDAEGKLARVRLKRGSRFGPGDAIGTINRMYHVHMNFGPPGGEVNPLFFAPVGFNDTVAPIIEKDGVQLFDSGGTRLTQKNGARLLVSGPVRIVVDAFDRTNMNADRRRLGLYKLGYQLLKADGTPAPGFEEPRINIVFDRLPADREATKVAYAAESGITVYGSRTTRFLYEVTNTVREGRAATGSWDSSQLAKGDYVLRIIAADYSGNEAQEGRDLRITVP
jgi:DNA-binding beta-propeller fold protein YncE